MNLAAVLLAGLAALLAMPATAQTQPSGKSCVGAQCVPTVQPKSTSPQANAKAGPQVGKPADDGVSLDRGKTSTTPDQAAPTPIRNETKPLAFNKPE